MDSYLNLFSISILISAIGLVSRKRTSSYIGTFRLQSVLLAVMSAFIGINTIQTAQGLEMIFICFLIVAVKVVAIPMILKKQIRHVDYDIEKDFFINIPLSIFISCMLIVVTYISFSGIDVLIDKQTTLYLVNSISVVLIVLFFMISRKKAIGQIIGLLVIENGLFTAAVLSMHGMPMIVEIGIFFDVMTAALIMGILIFKINETFDSIDINKMKKLRG
jgi:hydrogenase-4 component E